jgi:hypothetical protein
MTKSRKLLFPLLLFALGISIYLIQHKKSRVKEFEYQALYTALTSTLKRLQAENEKNVSLYLERKNDIYYDRESFIRAEKVRERSILLLDSINDVEKQFLSTSDQNESFGRRGYYDSLLKDKATTYIDFLIDQVRFNKDELRQLLPLYSNYTASRSLFNASSLKTDILRLLFASFKIDLLLSEEMTLYEIYREGSPGCILGFDEIQPIAVPRNSFVLEGQKVESDIFLATYNKAINPTIRSSEVIVARIENGVAMVEKKCDYLGVDTIDGSILLTLGHQIISKPWSIPYIVVGPGISFKVDKADVMYELLPNPVHIDIPGYAKNNLNLRAVSSAVRKIDDGYYEVIPQKNSTKDFLYIDAVNKRGKKTTVASLQVRVKKQPAPVCTIAGIYSGEILRNKLLADAKLRFTQTDSTISPNYQVVRYEITKISASKKVEGPFRATKQDLMGDKDIAEALNTLQSGDKLFFSDIRCLDEAGNEHEIAGCVLKII